jgi:hypothetical protein
MNPTANVRYIANGYMITSQGSSTVPATLYAATIPEVVFWLGKVFEPYSASAAAAAQAR